MSQTQVTVPDLGGIDEVEVIEISIKVGDTIEPEQEIIVLESDKATMEVPAPVAGKVAEILVSVGDKVSSGTPVVNMEAAEINHAKETEAAPEEVEESQTTAEKVAESSAQPKKTAAPREIEIKVPDIGGAESVEVIELSVAVGDDVALEESLLVLESDKATMEIPASHAGRILSFTVSVGDKVSEGNVIAIMEVDDQVSTEVAPVASSNISLDESPSTQSPSTQSVSVTGKAQSIENKPTSIGKVHAGPAVRQLARELGVDLTLVKGSGRRSRITKEDVQGFVKVKINQPAAAQSMGVVGSSEDFSRFGPIETVPLNKIKMVTAKNMVQSWSTIPQVTQFDQADITELESYRKGTMMAMLPEGVKVSPLAFILKACTKALQDFPQFNSSLNADGSALIIKQFINIGVAVETPDGLLVPVIKDADKKGIVDFAISSAELAAKARDKKLPMDGMMGGTFTISSLGGIGGTAFTPIVSAPQVAILGVSKASYKPIWNGKEFEPRLMLPLSLSYDHRVIDGAEAARFTQYICQLLADTRHMLL